MKTKTVLFIFLMVILSAAKIFNESNYMLNNYNVKISNEEYERLKNIGFEDFEIENMENNEFQMNKDIDGKVVAVKQTTVNSFDNVQSIISGYTETPYKILITSIVKLDNGKYRYKVNLKWKQIPKKRYVDVAGIGIEKNKVKINSKIYAKQIYCETKMKCKSKESKLNQISDSGGTTLFELPKGKIVRMESYIYFDVNLEDLNNKSIVAYGDYIHAKKNIKINDLKQSKIVTGGIETKYDRYFDSIPTANAKHSW